MPRKSAEASAPDTAPAPAPDGALTSAPASVPEITFATVERPKVTHTRTAKPNPFTPLFPVPADKALAVTLPNRTEADAKAVKRVVSQARAAAKAVNLTARVNLEENGENVTLTVWTVDQIKRPRNKSK